MYKQTTIGDIIDSEREMILNGARDYGDFFINASAFNTLLNNFIKSIDDPSNFIFIGFLSQLKKHHTLALFSCVRRHHIQAGMNLRQTLEAGAWAGYAIAHKDKEKFCEPDAAGILSVPKRLQKMRDIWLDKNFKIKSDEIKNLKKVINDSVAHSNIIYTGQNFEMGNERPSFETSFFDFADEFIVKCDLWFVSNVAMGFLDLFYGVNQQYKVFRLIDDFGARFRALVQKQDELKTKMMSSERFQRALQTSERA